MNKLITLSSLLGSSMLVRALGNAVVVNGCDYPVYLHDVPAAEEGFDAIFPSPLAPGATWSQEWTGLSGVSDGKAVHDGWSIKLSKSPLFIDGDILQYEYTYQPTIDDNIVWLDLSSVNGNNNPWLKEGWIVHSTEACGGALQQNVSYMNPDDNSAMQPACPASADFTVTLCKDPSDGSASSSSSVSSSAQPTSSATVFSAPSATTLSTSSTTPAPAPAASTPAAAAAVVAAAVQQNSDSSADFTGPVQDSAVDGLAFADKAVAPHSFAHTVTEVTTAWVTSFTTVDFPAPTEDVHKRHAHHAGHHHA